MATDDPATALQVARAIPAADNPCVHLGLVAVASPVPVATGVMHLEASGIPARPVREDSIAPCDLLRDPACTAAGIAALLRGRPRSA